MCKLSGLSDKSIGIMIRSYHFAMPLLLMLAVLIPDRLIANLAVILFLAIVFMFFLFNGCIISSLENKFCKDDFNIVDPLLEFTRQPINDSSRMVISYFILIINFSYAETINLENPTFEKEIYTPQKKIIEKIINENVNLWYGVYISNKKVGWFNGIYNKFNDDLYKIEEKLYLLMDMPGLEEGSKITTESKITYSMFYESTFPYRMVKYDELTTDNEGNEYSKNEQNLPAKHDLSFPIINCRVFIMSCISLKLLSVIPFSKIPFNNSIIIIRF